MAEAEQWRSEEEKGVEAGLKAIATVDIFPKEVANGHGLHRNGDADISDNLKFDDTGANVVRTTNVSEISTSYVETGESSKNVGEVVEEEIVELEFEKVKPKLATHSMHCPNCKSEITKVTLRRRVLSYRPSTEQHVDPEPEPEPKPEPEPEPEPKQEHLVGCLSCLRLFKCSDNGCFNPFDIFGRRPETTVNLASPSTIGENDSCFSMFWVIRTGKNNQKPDNSQPSEQTIVNQPSVITSGQVQSAPNVTGTTFIPKGTLTVFNNNGNEVHTGLQGASQVENENTTINIANESETLDVTQPRGRSWLGYEGVLAEILKSIVYGGLMEVIASLSVVASAAASDATTLSIISLALASLIGGAFVIGHNLWDLREDCYKDNSSQEATTKYQELFGQVNYFPLHAFFAILSFLVFGMIPPIAYGYLFHETNDKDYTVVAVATASLLCVSLLAICKAYISKCTVFYYFKTVVYYVTTAVSVSGVSYVAGNLLTRLMEAYGLFDTSSGGGMALDLLANNPSLATF